MELKIEKIFTNLKMSLRTYLILVVATVSFCGLVMPLLLTYLFPDYFIGPFSYLIYVIPIFVILLVISYPFVMNSKEIQEIERNMPLFVTRMATLSTSDLPVDRIFHILSTRAEYGRLAIDSGKIYKLIKEYHMGAGEACRLIASKSPNDLEADFLLRMAHAIEVGERLDRFLKNEQDVIMDEYVLKCEAVLKDLDFLKGIFASVITSLIFLGVFIAIIPILTNDPIESLTLGIVTIFAVIELLFLYIIAVRVPKEEIWYRWRDKRKNGTFTSTDRTLMLSLGVVFLGIFVFAVVILPLDLPLQLAVPSICLPVLIPGILFHIEERKIIRRDNIYGAFIRALGRSSEVSGQTMAESTKVLAMHKFGPLTDAIKNLSKRLSTRIDTVRAWTYFSAESSSNLINKFSEMYVHGTLNGGKPEPTSMFISNNMLKLLGVRTKRTILASNFVGVLYGLMIALSITMWITVEIIRFMGEMASGLMSQGDTPVTFGLLDNMFQASADIEVISVLILSMVVLHALFSALIITKLRGGHMLGAAVHFVALTWIGALSSYIVTVFMSGLL
jgi:flagellar protein FlaJ